MRAARDVRLAALCVDSLPRNASVVNHVTRRQFPQRRPPSIRVQIGVGWLVLHRQMHHTQLTTITAEQNRLADRRYSSPATSLDQSCSLTAESVSFPPGRPLKTCKLDCVLGEGRPTPTRHCCGVKKISSVDKKLKTTKLVAMATSFKDRKLNSA